jgi:hypothetical protein
VNELLAIAGEADFDDELVEEVARRRPREVTILIDGAERADGWAWDESPRGRALRDRLARLLSAVEQRTGASVMGRIGDLRPFSGRWFDSIVDLALPSAALP